MHFLFITAVILFSYCGESSTARTFVDDKIVLIITKLAFLFLIALLSGTQLVSCGPKDWLCIDGRNRRDLSSEATENLPSVGNTLQNVTSPEVEVTTIKYENITIGVVLNTTESSTNLSTTAIETTETPTTEQIITESEPTSVDLMSEGFPKPFPSLYDRVWK